MLMTLDMVLENQRFLTEWQYSIYGSVPLPAESIQTSSA
jgi:hypothetical protein